MATLRVLFVAAEAAPFFKTGGLADVIGSLPLVLADLGVETKVFLPFYRQLASFQKETKTVLSSSLTFAGREWPVTVLSVPKGKTEFLFLDQPNLYDRPYLYGPAGKDYPDSPLRFGFFSFASLQLLPQLGFSPQIVHSHDWHAALVPVYLKESFKGNPFYAGIKSIQTIHNLGYQGIFPKDVGPSLFLPPHLFQPEGLEFFGQVNLLKGGLLWADRITTVSPTYSEEIKTKEFGQGLEGVLQKRAADLIGIINGIDYDYWNPASDPLIKHQYQPGDLVKKEKNKKEICHRFSFSRNRRPLIGMVSRLVPPKGFDLIRDGLEDILQLGFNLVILGSGLPEYEDFFRRAQTKYRSVFAFQSGYNEELAHAIYAGADFFLMPSLFEPCGLGQMIALRYGTIPVVRRTGGLADSVVEFNGTTGNGFLFSEPTVEVLLEALKKAKTVYKNNDSWGLICQHAFSSDFSWTASARQYLSLYHSLVSV